MLKRKLAGLVVAGLLLGAGAVNAAEPVFPSNADEGIARLPPLSTYVDELAGTAGRRELGAGAVNAAESVFPSNADEGIARLLPVSTYTDQHAGPAGRRGEPVQSAGSPFPTAYAASSD